MTFREVNTAKDSVYVDKKENARKFSLYFFSHEISCSIGTLKILYRNLNSKVISDLFVNTFVSILLLHRH